MAQIIEFKYHLQMDLESRDEENDAYTTIEGFVTAQGGTFRWKTNQTDVGIHAHATLLLPVADRSEVHARCNTIEGNIDALPRGRECVRAAEMTVNQKGLPDPV